jgi:predicted HicB family RNase H-like nuclease
MQTIEPRTGKEVVGSTIRLPRNLRDETKIAAIRAGRSFNAHVVLILKEKLAEEADAK